MQQQMISAILADDEVAVVFADGGMSCGKDGGMGGGTGGGRGCDRPSQNPAGGCAYIGAVGNSVSGTKAKSPMGLGALAALGLAGDVCKQGVANSAAAANRTADWERRNGGAQPAVDKRGKPVSGKNALPWGFSGSRR